MQCLIGVKHEPEWGQHKITVKLGDRYDEDKAGYIPDDYPFEDISQEIRNQAEWAAKAGHDVFLTKAAQKYVEPDFITNLKQSLKGFGYLNV